MRLKSGEKAFDRPRSHVHCDLGLVAEALEYVESHGRDFFVAEVVMGRVVGQSDCVETTDEDVIVYRRRPGRAGPTRYAVGRAPEPSDRVTVILKQVPDGYLIITAWIGGRSEPEPWDRHATPRSETWWARHALVRATH